MFFTKRKFASASVASVTSLATYEAHSAHYNYCKSAIYAKLIIPLRL